MAQFTNPILVGDPQGLNRLNENFDYLNQNINKFSAGTHIQPSTNLNTITTPGIYHATNEVAATLTNCPISTAFVLKVTPAGEEGEVMQIITDISTMLDYIRHGGLSG